MSLTEEQIKATPLLSSHLSDRYKKRLEWVRVSITILTPSLVLLIGLQEKPQHDGVLLNILLLSSILLMTISILIGLWVLLGESEAHGQAAADIREKVLSGGKFEDLQGPIKFPSHQNIMLRFFPAIVWLAVLSLGAFGFAKYF
jgi:hypothetical protein